MRRSRRRPSTAGTPDIRTVLRVAPDLWPKDRPELRWRVAASMVLLILAKIAGIAAPWLWGRATDALAPEGEAAYLMAPLMLILAYGTARMLSSVFQQLRDVVFARVGQHALRSLAIRTFSHVHRLDLGYHLARKTGALSRIVDRGIKAIEFLLRFMLFSILPLIIELSIVAAIFAFAFGWQWVVVLLVMMAVYVAFTFRVTEWRVKIRIEMNKQDQDANQKAIDSLLNYETVKYFSAEQRETARYDRAMAAYQRAALQTAFSLGILNSGQALILSIGMVAIMALTAQQVVAGTMTVGDFVMANAYLLQITMPLNFLGTVYREIRQSLVDMREMYDLLDRHPQVVDAPGARPLKVHEGRVTFRNATFGYGPQRGVLRDVSFDVPGGRTLAVVGPSGAGKSTIARLLFRFYDVSAGAVEIDGQDVREVTQDSLRRAIGVVPQDTVLFNDTIGYNIAYGSDDATREQVVEAARAAHIHEFIESLPDGYDTLVGERGLKLSGGEKQRVAIARTILKDPPILILDEATSALDTGTERQIQAELKRLGQDRTVLMIAHRLSTVVDADEIVVLDRGRVVERGRHAALLAKGGAYARMWERQEAAEAHEAVPLSTAPEAPR